jgi:hypothetical protein
VSKVQERYNNLSSKPKYASIKELAEHLTKNANISMAVAGCIAEVWKWVKRHLWRAHLVVHQKCQEMKSKDMILTKESVVAELTDKNVRVLIESSLVKNSVLLKNIDVVSVARHARKEQVGAYLNGWTGFKG